MKTPVAPDPKTQLVHVGSAWRPLAPQMNLPPSIDRMRPLPKGRC